MEKTAAGEEREEITIFGTFRNISRRCLSRVRLAVVLNWSREKAVIRLDISFRDIKRINVDCDLQCSVYRYNRNRVEIPLSGDKVKRSTNYERVIVKR